MAFADADGVIRLWNRAAENLLGYPADAVVGRRVDIFIPPEMHELHWAGYERAMTSGRLRNTTLLLGMLGADGQVVNTDCIGSLVFDDNGQAIGFCIVMRPADSA
jgi:PAS domain S-box-containing protein